MRQLVAVQFLVPVRCGGESYSRVLVSQGWELRPVFQHMAENNLERSGREWLRMERADRSVHVPIENCCFEYGEETERDSNVAADWTGNTSPRLAKKRKKETSP